MAKKQSNYQHVIDLIKEVSGQNGVISIPRIFLKLTGDVVVALFLSQCVWWSDKGGSKDGWFWKSNKDWQDEIGLSYSQVKRAIAELEQLKILQIKVKKAMGAPTTHYFVDIEELGKLILDFLENREDEEIEFEESRETIEFQESLESITVPTQSSTSIPTQESPDFEPQLPPTAGLAQGMDGHQHAVDKANGGQSETTLDIVLKHHYQGFMGGPAPLPTGEKDKWTQATRKIIKKLPTDSDWHQVGCAIDTWWIGQVNSFWKDKPCKDETIDLIVRHIVQYCQRDVAPPFPPDLSPPPDPTPEESLWSRACDVLRGQMTRSAFDQYIAPCQLAERQNGRLRIRAPNPQICEWLALRFSTRVIEAVRSIDPAIEQVEFVSG